MDTNELILCFKVAMKCFKHYVNRYCKPSGSEFTTFGFFWELGVEKGRLLPVRIIRDE